MNNRDKLIDLMFTHKLDRKEVADLVRVKRDLVDHWLAAHGIKGSAEIPDMAVELLELKLKLRSENQQ